MITMKEFKMAVAVLAGTFFAVHNLLETFPTVASIIKAALR